jgi:hypothetical protein
LNLRGFASTTQLTWGPAMSRYNRVEGFSTGLALEGALGAGLEARASARLGTADRIPGATLTLLRTSVAQTSRVSVYHELAVVGDRGDPLSFASSLGAFLSARDEGFYYRASGAELGWEWDRALSPNNESARDEGRVSSSDSSLRRSARRSVCPDTLARISSRRAWISPARRGAGVACSE